MYPPTARWFLCIQMTKKGAADGRSPAVPALRHAPPCGSSSRRRLHREQRQRVVGRAATISLSQINNTFSAMATLKPLAAKGKGNVAVILPDTVSSTRYVEFDAPYLTGARSSRRADVVAVHRAERAGQRRDPASATRRRPSPRAPPCWSWTRSTPASARRSSRYAKAHGVAVIDYDRLTLGGSREYYVSFNNVKVGKLIGQGLVSLRHRLGRAEAAGHRHEGRADRQQRDAVRPGLRRVLAPLFAPAAST